MMNDFGIEVEKIYIKKSIDGLVNSVLQSKRATVNLNVEHEQIRELIGEFNFNNVYRFISVKGGFSSYGFINYLAEKFVIDEIYICSLSIGKKQIQLLDKLHNLGRIRNASFVVGKIFKESNVDSEKYDYFKEFCKICNKNNWSYFLTNNHAKLILCKTEDDKYFVLETSSNLNENPKIEFYVFQENKEIYNFYTDFLKLLIKRGNAENE